MKNYYITTAIAYTSGKPHIGNIYEIILADSIARFKRYCGYNVMFQTGTDEHGQKIEQKALAKNLTPQEFVNDVAGVIKNLWDKANISYDKFIRTTDDSHEKQVQKIFKKLYDKGDIYKGEYAGLYCTPCEAFWTESQLNNGKCPDCGRDVVTAKEEAYFFKMSKYADRLMNYYNENPNFIAPVSRKNEMVNNFLKKGLQDLCVSRTSFKWGIPVDFDNRHIVYVWLDALTNYITGLGYDVSGNSDKKFSEFWPADLHIIGKDIVRFHVIYWPIFLMALDLPLPKQVYGHGWLLQDGDKMSKSKGNVLYFDDLANIFGVDSVRYYVLSEMGYENDGLIGWELMTDKINSDLSNVYGNLVSRTIAMANKYFNGKLENKMVITEFDASLKETVVSAFKKVENKMNELKISDAISEIFAIFKRANKYIDETCPWVLAKNEEQHDKLETVLYNLSEAIIIGATMLNSFMPETANKVLKMFNVDVVEFENINKFGTHKIINVTNSPEILFPRLDVKETKEKALIIKENQLREFEKEMKPQETVKTEISEVEDTKKPIISFEDFEKLELKVGTVLECEKVEKSDKLLKSSIKIGNEVRTIVSGISQHYNPAEFVGKQVVVVTNLAPRKIKGIESAGMVLCAVDDETNNLAIISPEKVMKDGVEVG